MQLDNNKEDRNEVVLLFQDMLEVVTEDIMEDNTPKWIASYDLITVFTALRPLCFAYDAIVFYL